MKNTSEKTTEYINKMLTTPANVQNKQIKLPKSIVLDLGQLDRNRMRFENQ